MLLGGLQDVRELEVVIRTILWPLLPSCSFFFLSSPGYCLSSLLQPSEHRAAALQAPSAEPQKGRRWSS